MGYTINVLRLLGSLLIGGVLAASSLAHTIEEYMKLRDRHGIERASGVAALETLIGEKILEIDGIVQGTMRFGEGPIILLLAGSDGESLEVRVDTLPLWMNGHRIEARLLIRARRDVESGPLHAHLIAAQHTPLVQAEEVKREKAREAKRKAQAQPPPLRPSPPPQTPARQWVVPVSEAEPYYVEFILRRNKKLPPQEAVRIARSVIGFSLQYGVDARLVMAMVLVESGFNPAATSHAGAMGLGQLMPGTAKGLGVANAYDSVENLYGTVKLVRGHLEKYQKQSGDDYQALVLSLAAYNAGSGAVRRHGGVPPYKETQAYIKKVVELYRKLAGEP